MMGPSAPPRRSGQRAFRRGGRWGDRTMDGRQFDTLTRLVATARTRRQLLQTLGGGTLSALAGLAGRNATEAAACPSGVVCSSQCCPDPSDICLAGRCTSCPSGVVCSALCCDAGEQCVSGQCTSCPSGEVCSGQCCAPGETCQAGQCVAAAPTTSPPTKPAPSCVALGFGCFDSPSCCAPYICREVCCGGKGVACSDNSDCCPGLWCTNGQCGCRTCAQIGLQCGVFDDPCSGARLDCGACDARQCLTCRHNTCVSTCDRFADQVCHDGTCCTPQTAATACKPAIACGRVPDGCGGTVSCGACGPGQVCHQTGPGSASCCTPATACPASVTCGLYPDGCGGTLDCGACAPDRVCAGGTCVCPSGKCGPTCAGTVAGSGNYLCVGEPGNQCADGGVCPRGQACACGRDCASGSCVAPC